MRRHLFVGRSDRWCTFEQDGVVCDKPDRASIHYTNALVLHCDASTEGFHAEHDLFAELIPDGGRLVTIRVLDPYGMEYAVNLNKSSTSILARWLHDASTRMEA